MSTTEAPSRWRKLDEPVIYLLLALLLAVNVIGMLQYREVTALRQEVVTTKVELQNALRSLAGRETP